MTKVTQHCEIYKNLSLENLPDEIWVDIQNFEGSYQISNMGRVKSLARNRKSRGNGISIVRARILKQHVVNKYLSVGLAIENGILSLRVNRLVGKYFIENPKNKPEVNHIWGDKFDNRATELEWMTRSENAKHAFDKGLAVSLKGEEHGSSKLTNEVVLEIRKLAITGLPYQEIANRLNLKMQTVWSISIGKTWSHLPDLISEVIEARKNINNRSGEKIAAAKLKEVDVIAIREFRTIGVSTKELCKKFNASKSCIEKIISRKTWSYL